MSSPGKYSKPLLENKVCVITGAANLRSIGYATAEMFAAHGAKIVLIDIALDENQGLMLQKQIASQIGRVPELLALQCDLSKPSACDSAVEQVQSSFGTVDCLVHCAGIVRTAQMLNIDEAEFDTVLDVNLKGAFNICKAVLRVFAKQRSGVIVNLASLAAQRGGGLVGGAHYAASKGGVISLTRSIAREFAHLGIRANVICPAMIETSMLDGLKESQLQDILASVPLQKLGRPLDVAGACLFLASDLSGFVTGATVDVNGGIHIH